MQVDDAYKQAEQDNDYLNNFDVNLFNAKGEFIFLIDRSGSMGWGNNRIEMAK